MNNHLAINMIVRAFVPPCVVLVIDDNPYGLMVALSYTLGFVHMHCLKTIRWFQGYMKEIMCWPRCYTRNYPKIGHEELSLLQACLEEEDCVSIHVYLQDIIFMKREEKIQGWSRLSQRVNQVDQHTKHRRCTERDQVIPWYGKHCPLRFV